MQSLTRYIEDVYRVLKPSYFRVSPLDFYQMAFASSYYFPTRFVLIIEFCCLREVEFVFSQASDFSFFCTTAGQLGFVIPV